MGLTMSGLTVRGLIGYGGGYGGLAIGDWLYGGYGGLAIGDWLYGGYGGLAIGDWHRFALHGR